MKYMLLIYSEEQAWEKLGENGRNQMMAEFGQFTQEIKTGGQYITGSQLAPTTTATSVQVRNGKRLVTDGPFAETREYLGGYYLIEAKNLDEAISLAAKIPAVRLGTIEVRPLIESSAHATV